MKICGRCGEKIKRGEQAMGTCGIWIHIMPMCDAKESVCSETREKIKANYNKKRSAGIKIRAKFK